MQLEKTAYRGWNILFNGDKTLLEIVDHVIDDNIDRLLIKELKNNKRSLVYLIRFKDKIVVLKNPREKNLRKWIRFTTLYRRGEAFKALQNLEKLKKLGIYSNKPMLAAEKRQFGMVVDSWVLFEFVEGSICKPEDYRAVTDKLKEIHSKNVLHGDPQINNFIINGNTIITLDSNPKKAALGKISKYREFFYLQRSAPGIEKHFHLPENTLAYKAAVIWSKTYWKWRAFKASRKNKKFNLKRILVIRFSSFGDIILTTPVLAAIKKKYPEAVVDFLVMDTFKQAIEGNPAIDDLILFDKKKYRGLCGILRFSRTLKKRKYNLIIDLHSKIRSLLLTRFTGVRTLRYKKRSLWKSLLVPLRVVQYSVDDTIVRNYFKPLGKINVYYTGENLSFYFTPEDLEKVAPYQNAVVMAPGAANRTKQWPPDYFAALGILLQKKIVLIGGNEDDDKCGEIQSAIGEQCINLAGKLTLKESGALISLSKYVITNDSGPFHIARALKRNVFVIFGPTDPQMFTYNEKSVLIYAAVPCSPCSLHGDEKCPKGHFDCMKSLTPEKVHQFIVSS